MSAPLAVTPPSFGADKVFAHPSQVGPAAMEGCEGDGGGEELHPQPQPSWEGESGAALGDEAGGDSPEPHPAPSAGSPGAGEDNGSAPEQAAETDASDRDDSWEHLSSEPGTARLPPPRGWSRWGPGGDNAAARAAPRSHRVCHAALSEGSPSEEAGDDGQGQGPAPAAPSGHEVGAWTPPQLETALSVAAT